jgi:carbamoyltransferase
VQRITEELIFHILEHLHKKTGLNNICIAGGVAQNSVANGKITRNTSFKKIYIPSAGHDAGISMGAALWVYNQKLGNHRSDPVWSAYTGSRYSNEDIERFLQEKNIKYSRMEDEALYDRCRPAH